VVLALRQLPLSTYEGAGQGGDLASKASWGGGLEARENGVLDKAVGFFTASTGITQKRTPIERKKRC